MKTRFQPSIPTRPSLLSKIKDWNNQDSWNEFYQIYSGLVHGVARVAGLTEVEAQDVVQETFSQVAKNIANFKYNPGIGSFKSWLLHTTRWHIANQFRSRLKGGQPLDDHVGSTRTTRLADRIPDPGAQTIDDLYEAAWKENLQKKALERVKAKVKHKQYQAFHLCVFKQMPVRAISQLLGMTPNQIYLAKRRITKMVAAEVRRLERELV
jgi:RNA polymerase sigma-70 factor (ECF subfamily)